MSPPKLYRRLKREKYIWLHHFPRPPLLLFSPHQNIQPSNRQRSRPTKALTCVPPPPYHPSSRIMPQAFAELWIPTAGVLNRACPQSFSSSRLSIIHRPWRSTRLFLSHPSVACYLEPVYYKQTLIELPLHPRERDSFRPEISWKITPPGIPPPLDPYLHTKPPTYPAQSQSN